jgi:hypothetical protein
MKNNDTVGHGNPSLEVVVPKESLRIDIVPVVQCKRTVPERNTRTARSPCIEQCTASHGA